MERHFMLMDLADQEQKESPQLTSYSMVKTESFSSKIKKIPAFVTSVQHSGGSPTQNN